MTRTVTLGLALIGLALFSRGFTQQAAAQEGPETWDEFAEELADLQAEVALTDAMFNNDWRARECRFQSLEPARWTAREENLTAACVQARFQPTSLSRFMQVIACESGWRRTAYNPAGPYVGLGQHVLSAWDDRLRAYGPPRWELNDRWQNSRSMLTVTARMMHAQGLSPWSCA